MTHRSQPGFAVCIKNDGYTASLEKHKIYRVLPDLEALEDRELYPESWFSPIELPQVAEEALLLVA